MPTSATRHWHSVPTKVRIHSLPAQAMFRLPTSAVAAPTLLAATLPHHLLGSICESTIRATCLSIWNTATAMILTSSAGDLSTHLPPKNLSAQDVQAVLTQAQATAAIVLPTETTQAIWAATRQETSSTAVIRQRLPNGATFQMLSLVNGTSSLLPTTRSKQEQYFSTRSIRVGLTARQQPTATS